MATDPTFSSATVLPAGNSVSVVFTTVSDPPLTSGASSSFSAGFTVSVGGTEIPISSGQLDGASNVTIDLTLSSPIYQGQTVTVAYDSTKGTVGDSASNTVATFTETLPAASNKSTQAAPPVVASAKVNPAGNILSVAFTVNGIPPLTLGPAASSDNGFTVTADGTPVDVSGVSVNGATQLDLTLDGTIYTVQAVTVAYDSSQGNVGDSSIPPQFLNDFTLPASAVTNGSTTPAPAATGYTMTSLPPSGDTVTNGSAISLLINFIPSQSGPDADLVLTAALSGGLTGAFTSPLSVVGISGNVITIPKGVYRDGVPLLFTPGAVATNGRLTFTHTNGGAGFAAGSDPAPFVYTVINTALAVCSGPIEYTDPITGALTVIPAGALTFNPNGSLAVAPQYAAFKTPWLDYLFSTGVIQPAPISLPAPAMNISAATPGAQGNNISVTITITQPNPDPTLTMFSLQVQETDAWTGLTPATVMNILGTEKVVGSQPGLVHLLSTDTPTSPPAALAATSLTGGSTQNNTFAALPIKGSGSSTVFNLQAKSVGDGGNATRISIAVDDAAATFSITATWIQTVTGLTLGTIPTLLSGQSNGAVAYEILVSPPKGGVYGLPSSIGSPYTLSGGIDGATPSTATAIIPVNQ
jgi:uncharacterized repeat protein (TIGR02059 family)